MSLYLLPYQILTLLAIGSGVLSILTPTLVSLDKCTWPTVFKVWLFTIVAWIVWIVFMEAFPGMCPPEP